MAPSGRLSEPGPRTHGSRRMRKSDDRSDTEEVLGRSRTRRSGSQPFSERLPMQGPAMKALTRTDVAPSQAALREYLVRATRAALPVATCGASLVRWVADSIRERRTSRNLGYSRTRRSRSH